MVLAFFIFVRIWDFKSLKNRLLTFWFLLGNCEFKVMSSWLCLKRRLRRPVSVPQCGSHTTNIIFSRDLFCSEWKCFNLNISIKIYNFIWCTNQIDKFLSRIVFEFLLRIPGNDDLTIVFECWEVHKRVERGWKRTGSEVWKSFI